MCIALPELRWRVAAPCQPHCISVSRAGIRVHLENKVGAGFTPHTPLPPCYVSKQKSTLLWCPSLLAQLSSWNNTGKQVTGQQWVEFALSSLGGKFVETGVSTCLGNPHHLVPSIVSCWLYQWDLPSSPPSRDFDLTITNTYIDLVEIQIQAANYHHI